MIFCVALFRASHALEDQYSNSQHVYAKQGHQYDICSVAVQSLNCNKLLLILRQNKVGGVIHKTFIPRWHYIKQRNVTNSIFKSF